MEQFDTVSLVIESGRHEIGLKVPHSIETEAVFLLIPDPESDRLFSTVSCAYKNDFFLAPSQWQLV